MTRKIIEFRVEGSGYFPVDMLRYDMAWPVDNNDCASIVAQPKDLAEMFMQKRQVLLYSVKQKGPTIDRWASFGWNVMKTVTWKRGKMQEAVFRVVG